MGSRLRQCEITCDSSTSCSCAFCHGNLMDSLPVVDTLSRQTLSALKRQPVSKLTKMQKGFRGENLSSSLQSLCLKFLCENLEDWIDFVDTVTDYLPEQFKVIFAAAARHKGILDDKILFDLFDERWTLLDVSNSRVTSDGLERIAAVSSHLEAVNVIGCDDISLQSLNTLVEANPNIHIIGIGGSPSCDVTAKAFCKKVFPVLSSSFKQPNKEQHLSWEDLDEKLLSTPGDSISSVFWPTIDEKYMLKFRSRCPRVKLNETEVMSSFPLDSYVCKKYSLNEVEVVQEETLNSELPELSLAEKFKLAYDEREKNSAPKRAKNQRRRLRLEQYFEGESVNKIQHLAENFMHRMKV